MPIGAWERRRIDPRLDLRTIELLDRLRDILHLLDGNVEIVGFGHVRPQNVYRMLVGVEAMVLQLRQQRLDIPGRFNRAVLVTATGQFPVSFD
jgi:hypothetical protein